MQITDAQYDNLIKSFLEQGNPVQAMILANNIRDSALRAGWIKTITPQSDAAYQKAAEIYAASNATSAMAAVNHILNPEVKTATLQTITPMMNQFYVSSVDHYVDAKNFDTALIFANKISDPTLKAECLTKITAAQKEG